MEMKEISYQKVKNGSENLNQKSIPLQFNNKEKLWLYLFFSLFITLIAINKNGLDYPIVLGQLIAYLFFLIVILLFNLFNRKLGIIKIIPATELQKQIAKELKEYIENLEKKI